MKFFFSLMLALISTHLNSQFISFCIDTVNDFTHPVGMNALEDFRLKTYSAKQ